jgi:hypothetical protein
MQYINRGITAIVTFALLSTLVGCGDDEKVKKSIEKAQKVSQQIREMERVANEKAEAEARNAPPPPAQTSGPVEVRAEQKTKVTDAQKKKAVELAAVLINYAIVIDGVSKSASGAVEHMREFANSQEAKELEKSSRNALEKIVEQSVTKNYDVIQKMIRDILEKLEDGNVEKTLARLETEGVGNASNPMQNAWETSIEACKKAHQDLRTIQNRQRFEVKDKLEQLQYIPRQLKSTSSLLSAGQQTLKTQFGL